MFIQSRITATFFAAHPALRLVTARSATGDHIDLEACSGAGVTIFLTTTASTKHEDSAAEPQPGTGKPCVS